jgi:hypothetical protein
MPRSTAIARLVRAAGFAATVGGSVLGGIAHAQTTTWALPGDGVWNAPASWTSGIPSAGNSAIINIPITAFISGGASTNDLTLSLPGTVATIASGGEFFIGGSSVVNNGEIVVNTAGGSFDAYLNFTGLACTLSGTGSVVLGPNNSSLANDAGFQTTTAGGIVTNSAGHTIKGNGYVPAGLSNFGLITADAANKQLNLYTNPKANAGEVIASNGGTIYFSSCAITQTGTGVIRATGAGSIAYIGSGGVSLTGGTWEGISGGIASTGGDVTVDSITTNGTVNVRSAEVMAVLNSLTNTGTITVNPTGGSSDAYISFNSPASTITGGGTIVLNPIGAASGADAGVITNVAGNVVTNAAGSTIRGNGYITANVSNAGLINADIAARGIALTTNPKSNSGVMLASNGGTLDINAVAITQSGGGTTRADGAGSVVEAHGSITGGVLESINGGLVRTGGTLTLDGVTVNGTMHVQTGQEAFILNSFTNTGTITINPTGSASDAYISFNSPATTLNGGGTIVLNPVGGASGSDAGFISNAPGNIVTNPAGATIRGNGYINANINNQGLLAADIAARSIGLVVNPKSNSGIMLASNGGTLDINGIAITQSGGGTVRADGASSIVEAHGTLSGGTLESINSGLVRTGGDLTVTGTTLNGTMHVQAGHRLGLDASLVNNAVITVNPTGSSTNADINVLASLTMQGTGTVVFNGVGSTNDANVFGTTAVTLTNGPTHTLAGNGEINVRLTNDGTLSPGQLVTGDRTQDLRRNAAFADITCTSTSVVNIDLEGAAAGQFDRIVSGNTQSDFVCAGTLNVSHINGYAGSPVNTTFEIITATAPATISGTFSTVNTPLLPGGFHYAVKYLPTAVRLQVVCPADIDDDGTFPGANADGGVDINDLLFFLAAFEAGSSAADLDDGTNSGIPDNGVDISDLLFFLSHFEAGC